MTIDGYSIEVRHRIGISQQFNVTNADIAKLRALAYVGAGGTVQYFTNGFNTRTKGVDLVAHLPLRHRLRPHLATTLAYNYNKTDVTKLRSHRHQSRRASSTFSTMPRTTAPT